MPFVFANYNVLSHDGKDLLVGQSCSHIFHFDCYNKLKDSKCPYCRAFVKVTVPLYIHENHVNMDPITNFFVTLDGILGNYNYNIGFPDNDV